MTASAPRARRIGIGLLTASLAAGLAGTTATPALAEPAGGYVVAIGGAVSPGDPASDAIMQRIVDLAQQHAGPGATPRIAVLTTASQVATDAEVAADWQNEDNATANGLYYADWLERFGVEVYPVPIDVNPGEDYPGDPYSADNADDPEVAAQIAASDAVYFGGGDQVNYVRALMDCTGADAATEAVYAYTACTDTPAMAAIRSVVDSGGVSAGTSAGLTIQQGAEMISGGNSHESWRDGATAGWYEDGRLAYIPSGGFGFFSEGMLDSHFARRDRQPRIVRLAIQLQRPLAFGVEEKTALVVDRAARTGEVIGELGTSVLDVSGATSDGTNADGVRYSYLSPGSTIDFASGTMTLAGEVRTEPGTAPAPTRPTDIWGSSECDYGIFGTLDLAQKLVASGERTASGDSCDTPAEAPSFRTTFTRSERTAWNAEGGFTDLEMAITGIPALSASARVLGAGPDGALPAGSEAEIEVTVTNTGGTPLAAPSLADADGTRAAAEADPLQPGASTTLRAVTPVAEGAQTFSAEVRAEPLNADGVRLRIAPAAGGVPARIVGAGETAPPAEEPEGPEPPRGGDAPAPQPAPQERLARTGGAGTAWQIGAAGAALVAAGLALSGARRLRRR
ncbi:cyanophycinase [Leucobacter massiliensis]|uniref:Cyanophycinase n=1 Tax=Leucobacter massiliensis TaxID=1686285 RepID=A0A2S9QSA7_9MICO|nr:cyanophycinase [Leucobacter massiliensis]PRI12471.1 hypothetical protein B4915_02065 [Leucobacter massiliensis]